MSEFVGTPADAPPTAVTYAVLSIAIAMAWRTCWLGIFFTLTDR
jgi:hypothetical protein